MYLSSLEIQIMNVEAVLAKVYLEIESERGNMLPLYEIASVLMDYRNKLLDEKYAS